MAEFEANKEFNFEKLIIVTKTLTRLLDDSVEISIDNAIADSDIIAMKRRIGLGICGLHDLFLRLGIEYNSQEAEDLTSDIIALINYTSKKESVKLAR